MNKSLINIIILMTVFLLYIRAITLLERQFTKIIPAKNLNKAKINSSNLNLWHYSGVEYRVKSILLPDDKVKLEISRYFDFSEIKVKNSWHYTKALLIFNPVLFIAIHFMKTNFMELISNGFLLYSYLFYGSICLGLNYYHFYNYFSVQKKLLELDEEICKTIYEELT
jgi:hypothetical protein